MSQPPFLRGRAGITALLALILVLFASPLAAQDGGDRQLRPAPREIVIETIEFEGMTRTDRDRAIEVSGITAGQAASPDAILASVQTSPPRGK